MNKDTKVGKWIVVQRGSAYLSKLECLLVLEEKEKIYKCTESLDVEWSCFRRVFKADVLAVIPEEKVKDIRTKSMNVDNEYREKKKILYEEYQQKMLDILKE